MIRIEEKLLNALQFHASRSCFVHLERHPLHLDPSATPPDILNSLPNPLLNWYARCDRGDGRNVRFDRRNRILEYESENRRSSSGETDAEEPRMRRGSHRAQNVRKPGNLQSKS